MGYSAGCIYFFRSGTDLISLLNTHLVVVVLLVLVGRTSSEKPKVLLLDWDEIGYISALWTDFHKNW